jgi:hypothetical protein
MPRTKNKLEGVERRVWGLLEDDPRDWSPVLYGFVSQNDPRIYPRAAISCAWLDDHCLIDKPGHIKTEPEKLRGLEDLKELLHGRM